MTYTTNAVPPPSKERLERIQNGLRVKFPRDFLDFMKLDNGGIPHKRVFDTSNNSKVIDRFLPLMNDPNSDQFMGQYDIAHTWSLISDRLCEDPDQYGTKLVPVVTLEFGDLVCLDFRKKPNAPEVVVWDHEQSKELQPVTEKIACSFTEFLGMLKPLAPYKGPDLA